MSKLDLMDDGTLDRAINLLARAALWLREVRPELCQEIQDYVAEITQCQMDDRVQCSAAVGRRIQDGRQPIGGQ